MKSDIKMDFIDNLKNDLRKYSHTISSSLAHTMQEELEKEYNYIIEEFYDEYTPRFYKRHPMSNYLGESRSGLGRTYKRYYKNSHNSIYYGGIEITAENMHMDYHDSPSDVLNSFLNGYHGRASAGIESGIRPYDHMLAYRDNLVAHIDSFIPNAINEGKKQQYSVLRF